jgi:5-methylcytosine-specific restriction endonuclease McrA
VVRSKLVGFIPVDEGAFLRWRQGRYQAPWTIKCNQCGNRYIEGLVVLGCCIACKEKNAARLRELNGDIRGARLIRNGGAHSEEQWQRLLWIYGQRCLRCDQVTELTRDHVIPVARGGSDDISNIQPLCRSCNSWKGTRTIDFRDRNKQIPHGLRGPNLIPSTSL